MSTFAFFLCVCLRSEIRVLLTSNLLPNISLVVGLTVISEYITRALCF